MKTKNNIVDFRNPQPIFTAIPLKDCEKIYGKIKDKDMYIVKNLIERGLIMIYGEAGTGKTMLTEWLCYQLTRGDIRQPSRQYYFLGRLCYPCCVYYYTLDTSPTALYERASKYPGKTSRKFKILDYSKDALTDVQWLEDMREKAWEYVLSERKEHLVFVLDSLLDLQLTITKNINSPKIANFIGKVMNFTNNSKYGYPTVIITNRTNKKNEYRGSSIIGATVKNTMQLTKIDDNKTKIHWDKMRETALPPDMILQRNEDLTYFVSN